jgi:hypothetical protein
MRLLSVVLGLVLLGLSVAPASAVPTPLPKAVNPQHFNLNGAPAGTTLTLGSHTAVKVLSWSLATDTPMNPATGGAGAGKVDNTPLTVTVPFSDADAFLQMDAINGTPEAKAILTTPHATFTLSYVFITSFSVGGSDTSTTAQVTLKFSDEKIKLLGSGGPLVPCPAKATDTTICFPGLNPLVVTTWNMSTSDSGLGSGGAGAGKSKSQVTFSANVGAQGDALDALAQSNKAIKCVTILTSALNYEFENAALPQVQLQGSGSTATVSATMIFEKVSAGVTCANGNGELKLK